MVMEINISTKVRPRWATPENRCDIKDLLMVETPVERTERRQVHQPGNSGCGARSRRRQPALSLATSPSPQTELLERFHSE
jgi:hypothetical protein